jgi:hypothetical protein
MSVARAKACAAEYRATKTALLRDVAREKKTKADVVKLLRKRYDYALKRFLHADGTTYGEWLEHGPKNDLDEVLEAQRDEAVWDRLVDKHAPRSE